MKERIDKLIEEKMTDIQEDDYVQSDIAFLRSLRASYERWGNLTEKQKGAFERMEHLNSPAGIEEAKQWKKEYAEKHLETAKIVSLYYLKNTHFFRDLCTKIVSDPKYTPSKRQVVALCQNQYAKRVIRELKRKPIFSKGELVKVRENRTIPIPLSPYRGRLCVVIDNKLQSISSHAAGSKEYRLLPFGSTETIVCQERHVKAMRKRAK